MMKETSITYKKMKKSKQTKSNEQFKILRMISRDLELERNDGKFLSKTRKNIIEMIKKENLGKT